MTTSIIIATVFNDDAVHRAVAAIKANTGPSYELIVMDNGSEARGCVHAFNQGLRAADGDVLVCMNDDCVPADGWLEPLVDAIESRGAWLCCPAHHFARMAGHCMAFSRAAYEFTGGFDERYRHWSADHHFEIVLAEAGKPICQVPESIVHHHPDDIHRIHWRKSSFQGNHDQLPNTGQWYLEDNATFHEFWQGKVPSDYWPGPSPEDWVRFT